MVPVARSWVKIVKIFMFFIFFLDHSLRCPYIFVVDSHTIMEARSHYDSKTPG
jgi:hypothetical protein